VHADGVMYASAVVAAVTALRSRLVA